MARLAHQELPTTTVVMSRAAPHVAGNPPERASQRAVHGTFVELHVPDFALARRSYGRFGFRVARHEPAVRDEGYLILQCGAALLCFWGGTPAVRRHPYFRRFARTA